MNITATGQVLELEGHLDVRSTGALRIAIYEQLAGYDCDVVLDMSRVDAIDVTTLRLIAVATRYAWLTGHHLVLRNPSTSVRRMMHIARLAHALEVERSAATA